MDAALKSLEKIMSDEFFDNFITSYFVKDH